MKPLLPIILIEVSLLLCACSASRKSAVQVRTDTAVEAVQNVNTTTVRRDTTAEQGLITIETVIEEEVYENVCAGDSVPITVLAKKTTTRQKRTEDLNKRSGTEQRTLTEETTTATADRHDSIDTREEQEHKSDGFTWMVIGIAATSLVLLIIIIIVLVWKNK